MRTVIGLFEGADQAREALDDLVEFGAVREQITLLARRDDSSAFDRAIADYRIQANGAAQGDESVLLIITVLSTFDADLARDTMVRHGAKTVATRVKVWPHKRVVKLL